MIDISGCCLTGASEVKSLVAYAECLCISRLKGALQTRIYGILLQKIHLFTLHPLSLANQLKKQTSLFQVLAQTFPALELNNHLFQVVKFTVLQPLQTELVHRWQNDSCCQRHLHSKLEGISINCNDNINQNNASGKRQLSCEINNEILTVESFLFSDSDDWSTLDSYKWITV